MKVKIQLLDWDNEKELKRLRDELLDFAAMLELDLQRAEFDQRSNTFVVQLPADEFLACLQINGLVSFVILKRHAYEFVDDSYRSVDL